MGLKEKLEAQKVKSAKHIPPEARETMSRATADLRSSGILDGVVEVGSTVPDFRLENTRGDVVSLAALRARGPVIATFYRGVW